MRIKLDENIPTSLAFQLQQLGHDVETVSAEGLSGQLDEKYGNLFRKKIDF